MSLNLSIDAVFLRLVVAIAVILLSALLFKGFNEWTLARARGRAAVLVRSSNRRSRPAAATLLYFTTPTCAPCKTLQRPAIQRLQDKMGEALEIIEIDASVQSEIAGEWGVMSVPTTFILDSQGTPRHVNHGVAPLDKLLQQIKDIKE